MASRTQLDKLRESERLLEGELRRLRATIKAVERGENKRVKNTLKYIAAKNREIARVQKVNEKIREQELTRLEKFLKEEFESLEQARSAFARETRKLTKKEHRTFRQTELEKLRASIPKTKTEKAHQRKERKVAAIERELGNIKLDPSKTSYTVRQLSVLEKQQIVDFLSDRKTFADVGIGYLQPNERITVSVPYTYRGIDGRLHTGHALGRKVFRDWSAFRAYLLSYMTDNMDYDDWLGDIEVMKFPTEYDYKIARGRQTDVINKQRKDVRKMFAEKEKVRRKKAEQKATEKERKRNEAIIAKQQREIERLKKGRL